MKGKSAINVISSYGDNKYKQKLFTENVTVVFVFKLVRGNMAVFLLFRNAELDEIIHNPDVQLGYVKDMGIVSNRRTSKTSPETF